MDRVVPRDETVSPLDQYLNSSVLSVSILVVLETEVPIEASSMTSFVENDFMPTNPRFSSIMAKDEKGVLKWKRVKVKVEDHLKVPVFPGDPVKRYDEHLQDYLSKIAMEQLPQSRSLWEIHMIKYPTGNAAGTLVLKLHHSVGDGFTLMGALFSFSKRADDPSLPLTFPSARVKMIRGPRPADCLKSIGRGLSNLFNTAQDITWGLLKSTLIEDDKTPVRSGGVGVEFRPVTFSSITFSLREIREIKTNLNGTVNDVVMGIIFYGIHLYVQSGSQDHHINAADKMTALILLNVRAVKNYQTAKEIMAKPGDKSSWGNQFGWIQVPIPQCKGTTAAANPLSFVFKSRRVMKKKRNSHGFYLTSKLLEAVARVKGPDA